VDAASTFNRRRECERRFAKLPPADALALAPHLPQTPIGLDPLYPNPWPAIANVIFHRRKRLFDFASDVPDNDGRAVDALVFLALDEFGDRDDLVAWQDGFPPCAWYGAAVFLGAENLCGPRLHDHGLYVHQTPLDWLAFHQDGVVIVDVRRARLRLIGERLVVTDGDLANVLDKALRFPPPAISVMELQHV
jgi:hypothetical protein